MVTSESFVRSKDLYNVSTFLFMNAIANCVLSVLLFIDLSRMRRRHSHIDRIRAWSGRIRDQNRFV